MDIQQRRNLIDSPAHIEVKLRQCCQNNYWNATIEDRDAFNSEAFYTSVGSREILAVFKAGEKHTPQDRAFDIYLPRNIETNSYEINAPGSLIEIALTENFPAYHTYWAFKGVLNLVVNANKQDYGGTFNISFKDKEHREFLAEGSFAFSLQA